MKEKEKNVCFWYFFLTILEIFKSTRMRPISRSDESDAPRSRTNIKFSIDKTHNSERKKERKKERERVCVCSVSKSALATVSQRIFAFYCLKYKKKKKKRRKTEKRKHKTKHTSLMPEGITVILHLSF